MTLRGSVHALDQAGKCVHSWWDEADVTAGYLQDLANKAGGLWLYQWIDTKLTFVRSVGPEEPQRPLLERRIAS